MMNGNAFRWILLGAINLLGTSFAWSQDLPAFHIHSGALYFEQGDQSLPVSASGNQTLALASGAPLQIMTGLDERGFVHLAITAKSGGQFRIFGREVRLREGGAFYANVAPGRPLQLRVAWQHGDVTNSPQREDPNEILEFLTAANAKAPAASDAAPSPASQAVDHTDNTLPASNEPLQGADPRILRADRLSEPSFPSLEVLLQPANAIEKEPITQQRKPGSRN